MSQLPDGWHSRKLSEVCDLITDGSHFSPKTQDSGYPYITVRDLNEKGIDFANCKFISQESFDELEKNGCRPKIGDVLFSKDGTVGKVAQVLDETKFVVLSSLAILRPNIDFLTSEFLKYALKSPLLLENALGMKTGTALRRVVLRNLKTLEIPVPPIEEQHKIVELLEDHLSHLDAALADVKQAKIKAAQFRRSLLESAFTGKLSGNGSRLMTQLPDGWTWATIGEVCEKPKYGWTTSASDIGGVKLLRTTDLTHGPITWETVPFCKVTPKTVADYLVHPNDIFISRAGSVGVSVLVKDAPYKSVFASYLIRVRPTKKIDAKYLSLFLQSPHYWNQVTELSSGIALSNINAKKIQSMTLPLPPIDEQRKIVGILENHLSHLDDSVAIADAMEKQSSSLRRSLLQAAFTGQLTKEVASV